MGRGRKRNNGRKGGRVKDLVPEAERLAAEIESQTLENDSESESKIGDKSPVAEEPDQKLEGVHHKEGSHSSVINEVEVYDRVWYQKYSDDDFGIEWKRGICKYSHQSNQHTTVVLPIERPANEVPARHDTTDPPRSSLSRHSEGESASEWGRGKLPTKWKSWLRLNKARGCGDEILYDRCKLEGFLREEVSEVLRGRLSPKPKANNIRNIIVEDDLDWTTRFLVGEKVAIFIKASGSPMAYWAPAIVTDVFCPDPYHVGPATTICSYHCVVDRTESKNDEPPNDYLCHSFIHKDTDESIQSRPESFRFSEGDEVLVNTRLSLIVRGIFFQSEDAGWKKATVSRVECFGYSTCYAAYECKLREGNAVETCLVKADNDEHICHINTKPRERLWNAIEANCSYNHINQLATTLGFDTEHGVFLGLLVKKAIEHGSYNMLLWIQQNTAINLQKIVDSEGNNLLHQILNGKNCVGFFNDLLRSMKSNDHPCLDVGLKHEGKPSCLLQTNRQGNSVLRSIISSGNISLLSVVFSPLSASELRLPREGFLADYCALHNGKCSLASRIVCQYFYSHSVIQCLGDTLEVGTQAEKKQLFNSIHQFLPNKEPPESLARRLIGHYRNVQCRPIDTLVASLLENGQMNIFVWLVDADPSLLLTEYEHRCTIDCNEFAQPGCFVKNNDPSRALTKLDIVSITAHGVSAPIKSFSEAERKDYASLLSDLLLEKGIAQSEDFVASLTRSTTMSQRRGLRRRSNLLAYKLRLLQDDENLPQRCELLKILVQERGLKPPNVIDAIQWRQRGIVEWLVMESFVNLEAPAKDCQAIIVRASVLSFYQSQDILDTMLARTCLLFACIQFDDLQTLQWLVNKRRMDCVGGSPVIGIEESICEGWTLLHACAFYGRSEIAHWLLRELHTLPIPRTGLLRQRSGRRKGWEGQDAAHIAANQGFTFLADVFLAWGCSGWRGGNGMLVADTNRNPLQLHVAKQGKGGITNLAHDIMRLEEMCSVKENQSERDLMRFIIDSNCFTVSRWTDLGLAHADTPGPFGITFVELVKKFLTVASHNSAAWLLVRLFSRKAQDERRQNESTFWRNINNPLIPWGRCAAGLGDNSLMEFCKKEDSWVKNLFVRDTVTKGDMFQQLLSACGHLPTGFLQTTRLTIAKVEMLTELLVAGQAKAREQISLLDINTFNTLQATCNIINDAASLCVECKVPELDYYFQDQPVPDGGRKVDVNVRLQLNNNSEEGKRLRCQLPWMVARPDELNRLYLVMASMCKNCFLDYLPPRVGIGTNWDAKKEIHVTRIAAFCGDEDIIRVLLEKEMNSLMFSSPQERHYEACLGALESGRIQDFKGYFSGLIENGGVPVNFKDFLPRSLSDFGRCTLEDKITKVASSLPALATYIRIFTSKDRSSPRSAFQSNPPWFELLEWIVNVGGFSAESIFCAYAAILELQQMHTTNIFDISVDLLLHLSNNLGMSLWKCQSVVGMISNRLLKGMHYASYEGSATNPLPTPRRWFETLSNLGFDMQNIDLDLICYYSLEDKNEDLLQTIEEIQKIQKRQKLCWLVNCRFAQQGLPLKDIQNSILDKNNAIISTFRNREGLSIIHVATAYDRVDVLQWLIESKHISKDEKDGLGRNIRQVSEAFGASECLSWLNYSPSSKIQSQARRFLARCRHMTQMKVRRSAVQIQSETRRFLAGCRYAEIIKERRKFRRAAVRIQSGTRRFFARCRYAGQIEYRKKFRTPAVKMQSLARRYLARCRYAALIEDLIRLRRFKGVWSGVLDFLPAEKDNFAGTSTWAAIKHQQYDMRGPDDHRIDIDLLETTISTLDAARNRAMVEQEETEDVSDDSSHGMESQQEGPKVAFEPRGADYGTKRSEKILLTNAVMKFLRVGDSKFCEYLVRRLGQLANGDRSRILKKRLVGTKAIYESRLERNFRVLWTESRDGEWLLIWYIAKHKAVSRHLKLIEEAESRSNRQLTPASTIIGQNHKADSNQSSEESSHFLMLDPCGHTPLKLYNVPYQDLGKLLNSKWKPLLHLTDAERDIVETAGTVLVLGRSGTGKTVCICNRMDYDRHMAQNPDSFKQLFVARSERLCVHVEEVVTMSSTCGDTDEASKRIFTTFGLLIRNIEKATANTANTAAEFARSRRMTFQKFKSLVWDTSINIDPLVAWTSIRSLIKGSIEAVKSGHSLDKVSYMGLGKKRCRLTPTQRQTVYRAYQKYEAYCREARMWDDCDRILTLLRSLAQLQSTSPHDFDELCYDKIYVDEVQDLTQAEIALFFRLSGPGNLFFAGDAAQSVVEGAEFRFEDIRSVGHFLYEDRRHIPDKPKIVNVNFRSHAGILNLAAGVLDLLFEGFPDSAKMLGKDNGIFAGPRPSVLPCIQLEQVKELTTKLEGVVVLTPDEAVKEAKKLLSYDLIYGIREAKGMEYQSCILLDFFHSLSPSSQKHMRDLLIGRNVVDLPMKCPELEMYLKLLYTAVTRCIHRLVIVETSKSVCGDAFRRWVTKEDDGSSLAVSQQVDDLEKISLAPDEWSLMGLDGMIVAETAEDLDDCLGRLDKSMYCFERGNNSDLIQKATIYKSSVLLRRELEMNDDGNEAVVDVNTTETRTAKIVEDLLSHGLAREATNLLELVLPFLTDYDQKNLKELVLENLPTNSRDFI